MHAKSGVPSGHPPLAHGGAPGEGETEGQVPCCASQQLPPSGLVEAAGQDDASTVAASAWPCIVEELGHGCCHWSDAHP